MNNLIKNKKIIRIAEKNIRTDNQGYLWGKSISESNILNKKEKSGYKDISCVAERWICSDDRKYPCFFVTDNNKKHSLPELFEKYSEEIFSKEHLKKYGAYLGTIMKLIDTNSVPSKGSLSLQTHPCAGYPDLPVKPEMWLSLTQGSKVFIGWKKDYTEKDILDAIENNSIFDMLNEVEFDLNKKLLVYGGAIHAIRYGSFIAEWSKSPIKKDKGTLEQASVALADNTDGKEPREGKVNKELAIDILKNCNGLKKTDIDDVMPDGKVLYKDEKGNSIIKIFENSDIIVEEIHIVDFVKVENKGIVSSMFLYKGDIEVNYNDYNDKFEESSEIISPAYIDEFQITNKSSNPVSVFRWYNV
jgi:hypothetical protein